jgi:uncharacterized membrane protein
VTALDLEDAWEAETKLFTPTPRVTGNAKQKKKILLKCVRCIIIIVMIIVIVDVILCIMILLIITVVIVVVFIVLIIASIGHNHCHCRHHSIQSSQMKLV